MKSKDALSVRIAYLAEDGCGYTADHRHGVYGALPGELVTALPIARRRKTQYSRVLAVQEASAERVTAACSVADICGGCSLQHLHSKRQVALKSRILARHLGATQPLGWLAPLQAEGYHYRRKARLSVRWVKKKGKLLVGFREKLKPYVTQTVSCPVLREPVSELIEPLARLIEALSCYESIPQIEVAMGDEAVALVIRHQLPLSSADEARLCQFAARHAIHLYLQPGNLASTHKIYPLDKNALDKSAGLSYSLPEFGLRYRFSPHDFIQVNPTINRMLVSQAVQLLACEADDRLLDGFCGIGNFTLPLALSAGRVLGLEGAAQSIERARQNAKDNGIKNADFHLADLEDEAMEIPALSRMTKALLDPPRTGAAVLIKRLTASNVKRIVYVACNPETLARDVGSLVASGFTFEAVGLVDMFPQTRHLESIALLVR